MKKKVLNSNYLKGKGIESNFNTFPKYFFICAILFFLLICLFPIKVLQARDFRSGTYLKSWRLKDGEDFSIKYTHSVELTEVVEIYQIQKNTIILKETYFKSYGAGLPATTPYTFEITDRGFRIYNIDEIMTDLVYRTGAEKADHRIIIRDQENRFLDFSAPRQGVKLHMNKISLILYLTKEVFQ